MKIMVPNPMNKWDDLGGFPIFLENTSIYKYDRSVVKDDRA